MNRRIMLAAVLAAAGLLSVGATAAAAPGRRDSPLAKDLAAVDRTTGWTQLSALKLDFPTYHPEDLVVTADRFYLSSTKRRPARRSTSSAPPRSRSGQEQTTWST
jgi:hypothetical protein